MGTVQCAVSTQTKVTSLYLCLVSSKGSFWRSQFREFTWRGTLATLSINETLPRVKHCCCEGIVLCCFLHHCAWTRGSDVAGVNKLCTVAKLHPPKCLHLMHSQTELGNLRREEM